MFPVSPSEWKGGSMASIRSCVVRRSTAAMSRQLASILACESGTALGSDSDPDVKRMAAVPGTPRGMAAAPTRGKLSSRARRNAPILSRRLREAGASSSAIQASA